MAGEECAATPRAQREFGNDHSVFYFYLSSTLDEDQCKINELSTPPRPNNTVHVRPY